MTAERTYFDYLDDILDSMQKIKGFIQGMDYEQFCQDSRTAFAVVHGLEIIGEASKRVPDSVKMTIRKSPGEQWLVCGTN